ncbi:MAG: hypothetical protein KUG79_03765 [Pseudomonadales bacterium]|nr:hypothetical protein [Pseudomonadales bacterium]
MPNGNHDFDIAKQDAWFAPLENNITEFAEKYALTIDKYYHASPSWNLRFGHPNGGNASVSISNQSPEQATVASVWYLDNYDEFTRYLYRSKPVLISKNAELVVEMLKQEFMALVKISTGNWTRIASNYKQLWGRYSKSEFEKMGPHYPKPNLAEYRT